MGCALVLLVVLGGILLSSCARVGMHDDVDDTHSVREGKRFMAHISVESGRYSPEILRANSIEKIEEVKSLRVLVFDEYQNFLYSEDAQLEGVTTIAGIGRDDDFLPNHRQEGITEIRKFKVPLVKSSKKCYIHFVANHDWTGFQQDYFARGTSAGEFMNHSTLINTYDELQTGTPDKLALWSIVESVNLDENTFKNRVVKLLRNYAKVTLRVDTDKVSPAGGDERFELTGYALVNVPDKGTIAPFETSIYNINFPYPPTEATEPIGMQYKNLESEIVSDPSKLSFVEVTDATQETAPYYLFEKNNTKDTDKTYVIIRGRRYNSKSIPALVGEQRYYKIDLITRKRIDPTQPGIRGVSTYFHILRNKHYVVNVNGVKSDGYKTIKEAIESAAGNNVFADTRMRDFDRISDGILSLTVEPIQRIVVTSGVSRFQVFYSGGNEHVKFYPSWETNPDTNHPGFPAGEDGYNYIESTDTYLGGLRTTKDDNGKYTGFEVDVKAIPTDATLYYDVDVAALRTHNGIPVDATTGATSPLTRTVRIILHTPFPFVEKLESRLGGAADERTLSFRVYEEQIFPKTVFPFDVYIEAPGMTPLNNDPIHKVTIETKYNEERRAYVTYYKVTVQDTDRGRLSLDFKMNDVTTGTGDVRLSSEFYAPGYISGSSVSLHRNVLELTNLLPAGYTTVATPVEAYGTMSLKFRGETLNVGQFATKYGVSIVSMGSGGRFKFDVPQEFIANYGAESLTIISRVTRNPNRGSISYDLSATKTVSQWTVNASTTTNPTPLRANLELSKVKIVGQIYYYQESYYGYRISLTKPTSQHTFRSYYDSSRLTNLTGDIVISDQQKTNSYNGYKYHEYTLELTDPTKLRAFTYTGYYFDLFYSGYSNSYTYLAFTNFESDPVFYINLG